MKDNKLLAEFMGFKLWPEDDTKYMIPHFFEHDVPNPMVSGRDYSEWADSYNMENGESGYCLTTDMLRFNDSWDWLMCLVDKVRDTLAAMNWEDEVPLEYDEIYNCLVNVDLPGVYKAVIGFINWHFEECNKTEYDGN